MVSGFRRNDVWIPPCQARGRLIKSGMTLSVKQFMKDHSKFIITRFSIGFVIPSQKYCFFAVELLNLPYLSTKVYEVGYSCPCLLATGKSIHSPIDREFPCMYKQN
jgi:hypothetical protein